MLPEKYNFKFLPNFYIFKKENLQIFETLFELRRAVISDHGGSGGGSAGALQPIPSFLKILAKILLALGVPLGDHGHVHIRLCVITLQTFVFLLDVGLQQQRETLK